MAERLLKLEEVAKHFSMNQRTLRRLWQRGEFPEPIRLGRAIRWREQTLIEFVNRKCEQSQHEAAIH
jgi:predicted DNA-binding transcriptional regulator AlpA